MAKVFDIIWLITFLAVLFITLYSAGSGQWGAAFFWGCMAGLMTNDKLQDRENDRLRQKIRELEHINSIGKPEDHGK